MHRTWPERFADGYRAEIRRVRGRGLDGTPPPATGADGRHAVAAVVAANESWRSERPVTVEHAPVGSA